MKKAWALALFLYLPLPASAGVWDTIKKGASDTADAVGEAVSSGAEAVTDVARPDRSREEIDDMAAASLQRLFAENPGARKLYEQSYGYAVFDSRPLKS